MTIPGNVDEANLAFMQSDVEGQLNLSYYDSEMEEGEIGSRQFVTILDVIAEGEIAGFPSAIDAGHTQGTNNYNTTSLKDVFLNNTQVLRQSAPDTNPESSDFNFGTAESNRPIFIPRFGKSTQTNIPGFLETERDRQISANVTFASPQTVTITDTLDHSAELKLLAAKLDEMEKQEDEVKEAKEEVEKRLDK